MEQKGGGKLQILCMLVLLGCCLPDSSGSTTTTQAPTTEAPTTEAPAGMAPENVTLTTATTTSLIVTWDDPNGGTSHYLLNCTCVVDAQCSENGKEIEGATTEGECTDLTPGTQYNITVTVVVIGDDNTPSASIPGYTVAASPTNFTVINVNDTTLQASWDSPIGGYGGIELTYGQHSPDPEDPEELTVDCNVTSVDLANLTGNGLYIVTIETIHPEPEGENSARQNGTGWTLPSPVSSLAILNTTDTSITLSWSFPDGNVQENNLSRYVLTVMSGEECVQQITFSEDGMDESPEGCEGGDYYISNYDMDQNVEYTVTDLDPCNEYQFNVYAENLGGKGEESQESGTTDVGEPTNQTVITAIILNFTEVYLEWDLPIEPPNYENCSIVKSVINYTYKNCSTGEPVTEEKVVDGNATSATVEGLQAYWEYNFTVTSHTAAGPGKSKSGAVTNQTLEDTPGPPTNVEIVEGEVTHEYINVSWNLPDPCERNGEITGYNVSWTYVDPMYPEDYSKGGKGSNETNWTTYVIDAIPYKNYTIIVYAINGAGQGIPSQPLEQQTNEWVGGTVSPSSIEFDAYEEYAIVTWAAPLEPQGVITHYTVDYRSLGFPCDTYDTLTCSGKVNVTDGRSVNLTRLQPAQEFEFHITSWTSVGEGEPAVATANTTEAIPFPPTDVNVSATDAETLLVTWTKPIHYPGVTSYNVIVLDTVTGSEQNETVQGYEQINGTVSGLDPYWTYNVHVHVYTAKGGANSTETTIQMPQADPTAVSYFRVDQELDTCESPTLELTWAKLQGKERRGEIQNYTVIFWEVDEGEQIGDEHAIAFNESIDGKNNQMELLTVSDGLKTDATFHIEIVAYSMVAKGQPNVHQYVPIKACAPWYPRGEEEGSTGETKVVEFSATSQDGVDRQKQFRIWLNSFYSDSTNGAITQRGVYILQDIEENRGQSERVQVEDLLNTSWYDAMENPALIQPYRVDLPVQSSRGKVRSADDVDVLIGAHGSCTLGLGNECNGHLPDGRDYRVRVFVCTSGGCTVTSSSAVIPTDPNSLTGMIVGIVVGVACLIALIVLIVIILDRRGIISLGIDDVEDKFDGENDIEPPHPPNIPIEPTIERSRPVSIDDFDEHVANFHRDSNLLFAEEYAAIKANSADKPKSNAQLPHNTGKNRYTDILPFDDTRVELLPVEDEEPGSDYINGNYMMGHNSAHEFMAMQGPMGSTCDDFWRAIWEQNVSLIVMVTNLIEKKTVKCAQYWPDEENQIYGDVQVTVRSESVLEYYTIRLFDIQMDGEKRTLKQFHFRSWPDHGCPTTTEQLLDFVPVVRSQVKAANMTGPILVHCSAGVGRTGTFIVVDRVLQAMRRGEDIDIFGIVLEMRENRMSMVQSEDQYVYIHDCIRDAIKKNMHLLPIESEQTYPNLAYEPDDPDEEEQEPVYENYNQAMAEQAAENAVFLP